MSLPKLEIHWARLNPLKNEQGEHFGASGQMVPQVKQWASFESIKAREHQLCLKLNEIMEMLEVGDEVFAFKVAEETLKDLEEK